MPHISFFTLQQPVSRILVQFISVEFGRPHVRSLCPRGTFRDHHHPSPNWRVNKVTKIPPKKSRNLFLIKGSIKSEVAVYSGIDSAKEIKRKLQPSVICLGFRGPSALVIRATDLGQSARVGM